jgi:anionic cell wall polymer biosynthesis LytR-Cps2A-Psr (LCP) family protein
MNDEEYEYYGLNKGITEIFKDSKYTYHKTVLNEYLEDLIYEANKYKINTDYSKMLDLHNKIIKDKNPLNNLNNFIESYIRNRLKSEGLPYEDSKEEVNDTEVYKFTHKDLKEILNYWM